MSVSQFFFEDQVASGQHTHMELYETIQHAGFVLPRLYLMCVAGCACMKADPSTAPAMLTDLRDMCKGVQHPIHGLFLRSFLVSTVKPYLPDTSGARRSCYQWRLSCEYSAALITNSVALVTNSAALVTNNACPTPLVGAALVIDSSTLVANSAAVVASNLRHPPVETPLRVELVRHPWIVETPL